MVRRILIAAFLTCFAIFAIYKDSSIYLRIDARIDHKLDTNYYLMHMQHYPILSTSHFSMMEVVQQSVNKKLYGYFETFKPDDANVSLETKSCHLQPHILNCDVRVILNFKNSFAKIKNFRNSLELFSDSRSFDPITRSDLKLLPLTQERLYAKLKNLDIESIYLKPVIPGKTNYIYAHIIKLILLFFLYLILMYFILIRKKS